MMPSRMLIRNWLVNKTKPQITTELEKINAEYGHESEQDVRDLLNLEHKRFKEGLTLESPAEKSLLLERQQRDKKARSDLAFQQQLHRDTAKT